VVCPGVNAILLRACDDLAEVADALDLPDLAAESRAFAARGLAALDALFSERHGQYLARDRTTGALIDSASSGGLLPAFAGVPRPRAAALAATIRRQADRLAFIVASHDPADPRFDARRYWRGPVWLVVNYMIADGLRRAGETATADLIAQSSLSLIRDSGFAEYYDPVDGAPLGGGRFTWTAAMVLEFLHGG
jgi:glycogen debranching enzyme